jgi:hypothetical protein
VIGTDCTGNCKSNYNMITTKKTPSIVIYFSEYENIASLKKIPDVILGQYDVRSLVLNPMGNKILHKSI